MEVEGQGENRGRLNRLLLWLMLILTISFSMGIFHTVAYADGWTKADGKIYYTTEQGTETVKATGLTKIGSKTYYFDEDGVLQTGFVKIKSAIYFFKTTGKLGNRGAMLYGWQTINNRKFYFNKTTGKMITGLKKVGKYTYFFSLSSKLGTRGSILISRTRTYKGKTYYLNTKGHMVTNKWVKSHYYGSDGVMLVSTVTPDGWLVDETGAKVREVEDGYTFTSDETTYIWDASTKTLKTVPRILIVAGHGQGDVGATSSLGQEYLKTREFAALIYKYLVKYAAGKMDIVYYKNGSTSYDLYQRNRNLLSYSGVTGSGSKKSVLISQMTANSDQIPILSEYDYVLEIHFNATAASSKDISGNGSYKGLGFYVNSYRYSTNRTLTIERNVLSGIQNLGFKLWGGGIVTSSTLLNARICQEVGTDYALLETAFIDDADDMTFYNKKKKKMAKLIAQCIVNYYS